jgi:hypothetical protein
MGDDSIVSMDNRRVELMTGKPYKEDLAIDSPYKYDGQRCRAIVHAFHYD